MKHWRTRGRFALGGGIATAAHWAAMALAVSAGIDALLATSLGAMLGAAVNYGCQYRYTFASRRRHREALPRYLAVSILGWGSNGFVFWAATALGAALATSQLLATAAVSLASYRLYALAVFRAGAAPVFIGREME